MRPDGAADPPGPKLQCVSAGSEVSARVPRRFAIVAAAIALACSNAASAKPNGAERRIRGLSDEFVAARLDRDPDIAYRFGLPLSERLQGRLLDRTPESRRRFDSVIDGLAGELERIDPRLLDREHGILRAILREELTVHSALRVCHREWWDVSHIGGWLADILDLALIEPGGTKETRAASLERWSKLSASVDTQIANLETGLARGYSAPRLVVERTIAQLDAILAGPLEASPLYSPAVRDPDPTYAAKLRALNEGTNLGALRRYRDFLRDFYLPRSRTSLGVNALPEGEACYRALARRYTGLDEPIETTLARVEAANSQGLADALEAGAGHYGTRNPVELLRKAREDPAELYASSQEMMADARETAERARRAFAPLFVAIPAQGLIVQPYPEGRRGLGLPFRYFASGVPSIPATTWVPDERFAVTPRAVVRSTILHEGLPGHHMIGGRMAGRAIHPLRKVAYQGAFDEGWALYSESLAREAGMTPSPAGRVIFGINRAKLTLVEILIHHRGLTQAETADTLSSRGGMGQGAGERVARIAAFPGQQLSYTVGELAILDLRSEAERRLGDRFSLAEFHEVVLRDGWVPLSFLGDNVRAWIAEKERQGTRGGR